MKIIVTIYNDDPGGNRNIRVVWLSADGKQQTQTVIPPGKNGNVESFEILGADMLIVTATGT